MSTPLLPADSSALASTLARDWAVQVNSSTTETPTWVFVYGLSQVGPTSDITLQDDGDIHAGGYKSQLATAIGANLELQGLRKGTLSGDTFTADPGQEVLRAKGKLTGYDNIAHVRYWRTDDLADAYEIRAAVSWVDTAADKEALQAFTCTLTGRGKPAVITKPVTP